MIALVRIALSRPYTFVVLALLLLIIGPLAALRTPTDIFPDIRIPVIGVVWQYTGLPPDQMAGRITTPFQRALTTTVNDIEHIVANSYNGFGIVKIFFQPNVDIRTANAQVTAISQTLIKQMPPGATPPLILNYSASTVPIIQVALSGEGLTEQNLADIGINQLRTPLVTVPGAAIPYPFGGKQRQVQIDLNPQALQSRGLSGQDVANALAAQNLITPVGTQKIGGFEYNIQLNNSPLKMQDLADLPIKVVNGAMVYVRDVASVRDGNPPQTNIVHVDGNRSVLMMVLKAGSISTLDIIAGIKQKVIDVKEQLPDALKIGFIGDQSLFVRGAITGVAFEGVIAALLTSVMILLFLGSWRSTVIIAVSIPLSVLGAIVMLSAIGETLNIMTLGGLALAVGILVDDATVTIENIERHMHLGSDLHKAILEGAGEIAVPALVSTLCICIVFVPMFFLSGVARYLFAPLAEAVVFAMLASYLLSRTLVPTLVMLMMDRAPAQSAEPSSRLQRVYRAFDARFERVRAAYRIILAAVLGRRRLFAGGFTAFCLLSIGLVFVLGRDFFPTVDGGLIRLHMRLPSGTRIEQTARVADQVEAAIRGIVPARDLGTVLDNLGLPISGINLSYSNSGAIGSLDGEIQVALNQGHRPTEQYIEQMRRDLPRLFPGVEFFFQPADMMTQILNFGLPAAIDVQITGNDLRGNFLFAAKLMKQIREVRGTVDTHIHQRLDLPAISLIMDRTQLQQMGLSANDLAQDLLVSTAGTSQTAPAFWLNPNNGVVYTLVVQSPQYTIDSLDALLRTPIAPAAGASKAEIPQLLGNLVTVQPAAQIAVASRYNLVPATDIYVSVQGRDTGSIAGEIRKLVDQIRPQLPRGAQIAVLGQVQTMSSSFVQLGVGLALAIVMVYLLIVVNFQSWMDALIIISALPAALAGICWMLLLTATHLSVPALTGAIMTMGVATANSILIVSFARQRMNDGLDPIESALDAGTTRIRPVLMTALAMIIGMIPMALGWGEGAEQNAPLGRAVIGGLLFATVSTLFFVPVVFAGVHRRLALRKAAHDSHAR